MNTGNLDSKNQKERMQHEHDPVVEVLKEKAKSEHWITEAHFGRDAGIDLKLEKDNRIVIIEAAGERPNQKNVTGRVKLALGAIILDMKYEKPHEVYRYCLAFPATPAFMKHNIPCKARKQLGLNIILVECSTGLLKVLLPNGKDTEDAIDLSNFDELFHAD